MNTYFDRYAYPSKLFADQPENQLTISVVIPCYNEPDIIPTLTSLNNCDPVLGTEVLIIINEPENCEADISKQNKKTQAEINKWQLNESLNYKLLVHYLIAPKKDAGVGFARKVGMDEAARRFEESNNPHGVICCFDADSTCTKDYLQSIYNNFYLAPVSPHAAAIHFEHPITGSDHQALGIIQYELHLRYYVNALRFIGYPFAYHTVGSSMVVRSDVYQRVGGMNKRKAGEDFYFLHRVMPTGKFITITDTTIRPSARISSRVPFGTGKAMEKWSNNSTHEYFTYNLQSFLDLRFLFDHFDDFYKDDIEEDEINMPNAIRSYLTHISFEKVRKRLIKQSINLASFKKNWIQYFDGFSVLKYLHYARDNFYPNQPVISQVATLAKLAYNHTGIIDKQPMDWLFYYREKDKVA